MLKCRQTHTKVDPKITDLGQFGDGTFRRWWSQMFYSKKMCDFEILWRLDYKRCLLHVFLLSSWWPVATVVSRPSGFWKNLCDRDYVCKEKWLWTFSFAEMRRLW